MELPESQIQADKKQFNLAMSAAKNAFDPTVSAVFVTELNWRIQTPRVDGLTNDSARLLVQAVIDLAKRLGWEPPA